MTRNAPENTTVGDGHATDGGWAKPRESDSVEIPLPPISDALLAEASSLVGLTASRASSFCLRLEHLLAFGDFLLKLHAGRPIRKQVKDSARKVAKDAAKLLTSIRELDRQIQLAMASAEPPGSNIPELWVIDNNLMLLANKASALGAQRLKRGDAPKDALAQIAWHILWIYEEQSRKRATNWQTSVPVGNDPNLERDVPGSDYAQLVALLIHELDPEVATHSIMSAVAKAVSRRKAERVADDGSNTGPLVP